MHQPTHTSGNPVTVHFLFLPVSPLFLCLLTLWFCVCGVGGQFLFTPLSMCGSSFLSSSSQNDSSGSLIKSSPWTLSAELWCNFCSASLSLSKNIYPFATSHKSLISALSSICVGDKSPVSCSSAPALDRVEHQCNIAFYYCTTGHRLCSPATSMMKDCLQFLIEPAKKLKIRLKESRKRVRLEKKEPLVESQLFIMELARELNKICQRSNILSHIWTSNDLWPPSVCRDFIEEWAAVIEERVQPKIIPSDCHYEKPEKKDWKGHLLCMLEAGGECDMGPHKRVIMDWTREIKSRPQPTVWPGEPVLMMLDDLEFQWKRGRLPNLLPAMELVMLAVLNADSSVKEDVTKQWLVRKQRSQGTDAVRYIPHSVWNWICDAAEDITLDSGSANPDLIISSDEKHMRCGLERRDVPRCQRRFNGWWCAVGQQGYTSGRHYWEVEVGERDWRLGVAKASAVRQGFCSLNTDTGYLTLRLERGTDLKALTVPATLLSQSLVPRKVGVYLDYEQGQLSFYDVEKRSHLYTFNQKFSEELYPVFGTVEIVKDLVIRPADVRQPCLCPGPCLWN